MILCFGISLSLILIGCGYESNSSNSSKNISNKSNSSKSEPKLQTIISNSFYSLDGKAYVVGFNNDNRQ
ncbi:MAG: hypothetical protein LBF13_05430 [Campylobacteraceae bacterium]|nr:hypothetical protein [Campylobacteraceae bacterium]